MCIRDRINNYGLSLTSNGNMMCVVRFQTIDPPHDLVNWTGTFASDKALDRTLNTLELLGFSGSQPENLALGPKSNLLSMDKEFEITVVHETSADGRTFPKVQYVRDKNKFASCSKEEALKFFNNIKLADKIKLRKFSSPTTSVEITSFDEIPF